MTQQDVFQLLKKTHKRMTAKEINGILHFTNASSNLKKLLELKYIKCDYVKVKNNDKNCGSYSKIYFV